MTYQNPKIADVAELLKSRFLELEAKADILKAVELRALYAEIPQLPPAERGPFGKEINMLKSELQALLESAQDEAATLPPIDVTAPFGVNTPSDKRPHLFSSETGSIHPLMAERQLMLDIFYRMGFSASESRELDDDYHMFSSLNFPEDHPARDDYDTFMTTQTDANGKRLIAPAHTSTMQNRTLKQYAANLERGQPIAMLVPDRVFRNEDLDARHEHTFYQYEGIYVDKSINVGHLQATLKTFFEQYFQKEVKTKIQPFYFPFTEPSFEFVSSCPFCEETGCNICSQTGWIELLGCGMIHPNVLRMADINPEIYTGFAWGGGIERLVMVKYGIEDVRYFESGRLDFLRQFA